MRRVDVDAILVVDCVVGSDDCCFEVLAGTVKKGCCDVRENVLNDGELDGERLGSVGGASVVAANVGVATV